jgi:hypothetical protein
MTYLVMKMRGVLRKNLSLGGCRATIVVGDKTMKLIKRIAIATLVMTPSLAAPAWSQGTAQQRAACTPDVFRLCSAFIPDSDRITACLVSRQQELSDACASVFSPSRSTMSGAYLEPTHDPR